MARRGAITFEELADRYLEQHAKQANKAWKKQDRQVRRHLTPAWGKLKAASITRRRSREWSS
ncbi:MAG: hypothetical protein ACM3IH_16265 [Sphingobacteriales bacterium]|jgi:hypothetical protein